jgi:hypothetical protein
MARKLGFAAGMIAIAALAAFFAAGASAQSATTAVRTAAPAVQSATPASIEDQLTTQFKLVKLGSHGQVVLDAGTVLTIQKGGLVGFSPWLPKVCPSTYKDGKMNSPNALCLMAARDVTRDLTKGEKVYVENIDVDQKNNKIEFKIVECDSCNGNRSAYKAKIEFQFPKGQLNGADVAKISNVIGEVFAVDAPADDTDAQNVAKQPSATAAAPDPSAAPSSANEKTPAAPDKPIQVGQSIDEAQANTGGKLDLATDLGNTQIYRYNGQRITVENGKVTNIQ